MVYTIDGDPSDGELSGLNTGDWSGNKTRIPAERVSFVPEDNANPRVSSDFQGVHIRGIVACGYSTINSKEFIL